MASGRFLASLALFARCRAPARLLHEAGDTSASERAVLVGANGDLKQLILGTAPVAFLLEVALRTVVVYALLVVLVRLLGKRMSGQIGNLELAVMIVLGAIVAGAFQIPNQGVLPALVLLATTLALQRALSTVGARFPRFERLTQGATKLIAQEGLLQLDELGTIGLSREQVFAELRGNGIRHLGQIKRLYHEASGEFSIFRRDRPRPGLSVLPNWDKNVQGRVSHQASLEACAHCGQVRVLEGERGACSRCHHCAFEPAVLDASGVEAEAISPSNSGG